ncbi:MAG: hypothetical protein JEY94_00950 [Melioribacteraceae bacterium]|nr:hypothetical protein [Melioribacteraceae bacterium]
MSGQISLQDIESFSSTLGECIKSSFEKKDEVLETLNLVKKEANFTKDGEKTLNRLIKELSSDIEVSDLLDDSTFVELISLHCLIKLSEKVEATIKYKLGSTKFPDITIEDKEKNRYGFEIKRVGGDAILGNSSTQTVKNIDTFKKIYAISFFNDGDTIHISNYEDLIFDIEVDHNPRFRLKMQLEDKSNFKEIFSEGNLIDYYSLDQESREKLVANYLRKKYADNEDRWFLGQSTTIINEFLEQIQNIKLDREKIRTFVFCNYPAIFTFSNYHDLRKVIMKKYKYIGAVKDIFTAGGQENGFPRIYVHLITLLPQINSELEKSSINKSAWIKEIKDSVITASDLSPAKQKELFELVDKHIT